MSILLSLETIATCDNKQEIAQKYKSLYIKNSIFRQYVNLCYYEIPLSKTPPEFSLDSAPAGLNLSCLEQQFKKFKSAFYDNSIKEETRKKMCIQVFESLNTLEIEFLKEVLRGNIKGLSKKRVEDMNAVV